MAEKPTTPTRVTYDYVTRTIARTLSTPSRGYFLLLGAAVALLGVGIITLLYCCGTGLGLAGYSHPCTGRCSSPASSSGGHRALRHPDFRDSLPVPLRLAHRRLPHRRGDDGVRGDDRRVFR